MNKNSTELEYTSVIFSLIWIYGRSSLCNWFIYFCSEKNSQTQELENLNQW